MKSGQNCITVYVCEIASLFLDEDNDAYLDFLEIEERKKACRFVHREDRIRSAISSLLKKYMARTHTGIQNPKFGKSTYNKPYLISDRTFQFNISHAGNLVVGACAKDVPVGVDVEQSKPIAYAEYLSALPEEFRQQIRHAKDPLDEFYRVWTILEAYGKQQGIGIALLDQKPHVQEKNGVLKAADANGFLYSKRLDGHWLCVCSEQKMDSLSLIKIAPDGLMER